jgi:hypothetical protein
MLSGSAFAFDMISPIPMVQLSVTVTVMDNKRSSEIDQSQSQPLALAPERCLQSNMLPAGRLRQDISDLTEHLLETIFYQSCGHNSSYSSFSTSSTFIPPGHTLRVRIASGVDHTWRADMQRVLEWRFIDPSTEACPSSPLKGPAFLNDHR